MFNPYLIGGVLLAWSLSLVAVGYWQRVDSQASIKLQYAQAQEAHTKKVAAFNAELFQTYRKLEIAEANKRIEVRNITTHNVTEVPVYVTKAADARCIIPTGLVLHHNSAAAGLPVDPAPARGLVDTDSGLALSEVESTVASNYGTAHEWRAALVSCRSMYTEAYESIKRFTSGGK
jgi:hypothetical protein